jgi:hypothetical protein
LAIICTARLSKNIFCSTKLARLQLNLCGLLNFLWRARRSFCTVVARKKGGHDNAKIWI